MLVAADVGNSGVKVGAFDGETLLAASRADLGADVDLPTALGLAPEEVEALVCVSVNQAALDAFLAGPGRGGLVLGRDLPLLIENRYVRPEEVGHDRLANAAAAHERAGGAALAVDLGSAVTVDAVGADGAFLGGPIAPGRPALAAGLAATAPALPRYDGSPPPDDVPTTTDGAIRMGVLIGLAGLVDRLVRETAARAGGDRPVFLTGGDAAEVRPYLETPTSLAPHLTLNGVRVLYDRARRR